LDRAIQIRLEYRYDAHHLPEGAGNGIAWAYRPSVGGLASRGAPLSRLRQWAAPHLQIVAMKFTIGSTPLLAE
jgi:hypothetical protein